MEGLGSLFLCQSTPVDVDRDGDLGALDGWFGQGGLHGQHALRRKAGNNLLKVSTRGQSRAHRKQKHIT